MYKIHFLYRNSPLCNPIHQKGILYCGIQRQQSMQFIHAYSTAWWTGQGWTEMFASRLCIWPLMANKHHNVWPCVDLSICKDVSRQRYKNDINSRFLLQITNGGIRIDLWITHACWAHYFLLCQHGRKANALFPESVQLHRTVYTGLHLHTE